MLEEIRGPAEYDGVFSKTSKVLFVKFYSKQCKPCRKIEPLLQDLSDKYSKKCRFIQVDADNKDNDIICTTYNVESLPTIVLIDKKEVKKIVVGADEKVIKSVTREVISSYHDDSDDNDSGESGKKKFVKRGKEGKKKRKNDIGSSSSEDDRKSKSKKEKKSAKKGGSTKKKSVKDNKLRRKEKIESSSIDGPPPPIESSSDDKYYDSSSD